MYRTEFIKKVLLNLDHKVLLGDNDGIWLRNSLKYISQNHKNKDLIARMTVEGQKKVKIH